jgi:hypothetical protein
MTAAARGGKMSAPRKERRPLLIGLFASIMGSALVLPDPGLADVGKSPSYVRMDHREDTGEEEASLREETLKLEAVLAYAQEHNPAIRVAKSRLLAAQKVPAQASAYDDLQRHGKPGMLLRTSASTRRVTISSSYRKKSPFRGSSV